MCFCSNNTRIPGDAKVHRSSVQCTVKTGKWPVYLVGVVIVSHQIHKVHVLSYLFGPVADIDHGDLGRYCCTQNQPFTRFWLVTCKLMTNILKMVVSELFFSLHSSNSPWVAEKSFLVQIYAKNCPSSPKMEIPVNANQSQTLQNFKSHQQITTQSMSTPSKPLVVMTSRIDAAKRLRYCAVEVASSKPPA